MAQLNFDPSQYEPEQDFSAVPGGDYVMSINASSMEQAKSNPNNAFLLLDLVIMDGEHKGRRAFDRLNLINTNETAVEIATRRLAAICNACSISQLNDSVQLHGIPMLVSLDIEESPEYSPKNVVRSYRKLEGTRPAQPAHTVPTFAPPVQPAAQPNTVPAPGQPTQETFINGQWAAGQQPDPQPAQQPAQPQFPWSK